jgi:hypothetical protein
METGFSCRNRQNTPPKFIQRGAFNMSNGNLFPRRTIKIAELNVAVPLEKKTVIKKQKEMLVMAKTKRKKKNKVPSDFSRTASDPPPYQRDCSIKFELKKHFD